MAGNINTVKILISGRVQMVGFRYFTVRAAKGLNIKGYVKNLPSGEVEIVASGGKEKLEELIQTVRRGPPAADVQGVKIDRSFKTEENFEDFDVRF